MAFDEVPRHRRQLPADDVLYRYRRLDADLFFQAITKFFLGLIILGILVFLPAGTLNYPNGWLFIGLLFIPMFIAGVILLFKAPDLLSKRLNYKEKES